MKVKKEEITKIVLHTSFEFAHWDNAVNTAISLAQAGRFVNITNHGGSHQVNIYKRV